MICDIEAAAPDGPLHRVGRRPDAWAWPDWSHAGPDGTFGSRFDDPRGEYRVLYASSARRGADVEVVARFRADPAVEAGLREIEAEAGEDEDGPRPGQLPRDWLESHAVGTAQAHGAFAAVGSARSLAYLRDRFADRALHYGIDELDAASIRRARPRRLRRSSPASCSSAPTTTASRSSSESPTARGSATSSRTGLCSSRAAATAR